ncbi:MAG: outer membrane protein assembly factor BamA [Capnocytophaga sp.]|nr:outer membrane protein assembly factor BamA [Capnocytophaga sp.]
MTLKRFLSIVLFAVVSVVSAQEEERLSLEQGRKYTIGGIEVTGAKRYNEQTILTTSGLKVGDEITIPGEKFSNIIHKLWSYKLFSDVNIYITRTEGNTAFLELAIREIPSLTDVTITGIRAKKAEGIIKDAELKKGAKVNESFIANTRNYLVNKYRKEGYLNAKVTIDTKVDTTDANGVKMLVHIDQGDKVKIDKITFGGNEKYTDAKLRSKLKKTKQRILGRFWKRSKYVANDYTEDLVSLIDFYKENGYRDARVVNDTLIYNNDGRISLNINVEEGDRYYFGDIRFLGNSVYNDRILNQVLGIKKGDVYNGVLLKKRIADASKPDAEDITNLYQNSGYLFSRIMPVETSVVNDTINFEIRVVEGKPAYFNNISVVGNEKTNDHVIYRELRTRPGYLYTKDAVVRTVRELSQMGFFDAQNINPEFKNADPNAGTVDIEYQVAETGSSQIELQGGYGGGSFIGTLGLSFNNFSIRNIFNKEAYTPVPMGDGQSLALRLQASRYYRTYSFSFSEPWMGGKQPVQFSVSLSRTEQYSYNAYTYNVDRSRRFLISGIMLGLAKRLRVPDDYFQISHTLGFQHYNLKNYNTGLFTFGDGHSNSLTYTIGLTRNSSGPNPIYPMTGSNFNISAKLTPPYSLFNNTDYKALMAERATAVSNNDADAIATIDQQRFNWLEFYKLKASGTWYTNLFDKFVLKTAADFGYLGAYNGDRGLVPFERFFVGGDGLAYYALDGRENIQLRGYENQSLSSSDGDAIFNKFSLELRYPITLKPMASIYGLVFAEGGNAYSGFSRYNPFELKRSAGLGMRIFMPAFGMLGIDFGYGFDNQIGRTGPSGWQTHFIFGQQF